MTEAKPSGIRPPSKIGRPCCTLPPRPAIPPSSPKASGNSMDHLWETHGRKLNEAGLRRGSDTSVVLTEDTDSFIIGDRVWVGGTKPGSIAYIGETQFAPGDWAGVVLDEPIGKNDGSVAGCRYFQCEPKRGIFSRLTRLTRQPLPEASSSPILRTPTTPPDSTRGCLIKSVSPSLNASTTSLSSTVSQRDLKIGERVIVSSSQGSKTGVLRYMGITEFASGEWCGIELDEPLGKNDGSVNDKRYFECRPKYGLFAPMHKVSKSPLNKRTSCVVHRPSGAALNSTLKRTNSRESLVSISSVNSSIAGSRIATGATRRPGMRTSTPIQSSLQEMLKEKQQEIEFLRRERDLERDRVTKAANQADQAEQSVILIKQEYDKYREEMEKTVLNAEMALNKILEEKNALAIQLEEERRKCEDLLFRFEEESVNKDDIQKERSDQSVINTVNENRIKELEKLLSEERERVIQLERDSTKLFEAEEELARLRSCQTSNQDKTEFEDLRNRNENLKETKDALEKQVNEKTVLVEEYLESMKNLEIKLKEKEEEGNLKKQVENDLQNNLKETKENLREKLMYIENMRQVFETNTNALKKELTEMKKRIEDVNEKHATEKQSLIVEYEKIVEDKNKQIEMKSQQLTSESQKYLESQSNVLENLKAENMKHINELSESFGKQLNVKDSKLKEISSQLNEKISEAQKLSNELSNQQDLYNRKDKELNDILHKLEELNVQLKAAESKNVSLADQLRIQEHAAEDTNRIMKEKEKLEEDLSMLRATATDSSAHLEKLNEELKLKDKELAELRASMTTQIEELKKEFQGEIDVKSKYIEEINLDASQKTMILNKKEKEISELKSLVESKDEEIKHLVEKNSELQYALTLSEQTKTNLESELRVFESNIENLNQQLARAEEKFVNVSSQKDKLELDIANLISSSANSSEQLTKYNDELREKERDIDKLQDKLYQMEKDLTSTQGKLENTEKELNKNVSLLQESRLETENVKSQLIKEKELCLELSEKIKKHESKENDLLNEIEIAKSTELSLKEKCNLISDLNDKLKKIEEDKVILRKEYEIAEESFKKESLDLQKQLDDAKTQLIASKEEIQALQKAKVKLEANQSASRWSIEELTDKLNSETKARTKLDSIIAEKDSKIKSLDDALSDLRREKEMINLNREMINQETVNTLSSMENTIADLNEKLVVATGNIETKSNELAIAQAEAEQRKTQISELTVESDSLKNSLIQINDKLHSLENKLKEKDNELRKTEEDKTRLENNLKQVEIELKNVQSDIVTKNNILAELNDKIKDVQDTKEDFIIKLQNKLESDIKAKESALEISEKQRNELVQVKESLEQLLATKSADLNANEITMNNLKEQLKVLQDKQEHTVAKEDSKKEEVKAMMNEIEEMRKENTNLLITKDTLEKLIMEQGSQIDILTNTIKSKEKEAEKNTQNLIEKLNIVTTEAAQLKEVHSRLEKENKQIASKLSEATNQLKLSRESIKNNFDAAGGDVNQQMDKDIEAIRLKEENEIVKGQIDFLNSVIVDMQRKNETLLCKIEVLEMGVPANEADDYNRTTLDKRNKAPRMFCDICDQFDLHETEDCPRQAQDFTEPEKIIKSPKKSSLERPYCENCETFGHDTRDCDDTETY